MNKTKATYLGEISTILVSVASILFFYWLLSSPIQREFAFQDIQERKAIIKDGNSYETIKLIKIDMVWYVMDEDSSLEGKFKSVYSGGKIIQLESPETGVFEPIER